MELRQCRYFVAIAEEMNVTHAARKLHLSQPALSKQLKELEAELGVTLFTRERQGLRLTEGGQQFLVHARDLLGRAATAMAVMRPLTGRSRSLVVGYSPLMMPDYLAGALRRANAATPGFAVQLKGALPGDQVRGLREGTIDVALLGNPPAIWKREFATRCLTSVPIVAVVPEHHQVATGSSLDLAALAGEPFVGFAEQSFPGRNECVRDACERAGFEPRITRFADSLTALTGMVAAGLGVALAPAFVEAHPMHGVRVLRLRRPRVVAESFAAWRKDRASSVIAAFTGMLLESARERRRDSLVQRASSSGSGGPRRRTTTSWSRGVRGAGTSI